MKIAKSVIVLVATMLNSYAQGRSLCIAHRGNQTRALENSMEAIKAAVEFGTDGVEYDIVHTKDGIPLVFHDKELGRTTMSTPTGQCPESKIAELSFKEINENCMLTNGEAIPLLVEVVEYLNEKDAFQLIEFKDRPSQITIEYLAQALRGREEKARFISFKGKYLDLATKGIQNLRQDTSPMKALQLYRLFDEPKNHHGVDVALTIKTLKKLSKQNDRETGVYTVNSAKKLRKAARANVTFITTNDPELCLQSVNKTL